MSDAQELFVQAKAHLEKQEYEASITLLKDLVRQGEATDEMRQALEQAEEGWEIFLSDRKKEAMDCCDHEDFTEGLRRFTYLAEKMPDDRTVQDYLQLCQQMTQEGLATAEAAGEESTETPPTVESPATTGTVEQAPIEHQAGLEQPESSPGMDSTDNEKAAQFQSLLTKCQSDFAAGKWEDCLARANEALELEPGDQELLETRAKAEKALQAAPKPSELDEEVENLRQEGTRLFEEGQYADSLKIFNYVCQLAPHDSSLAQWRTRCKEMLEPASSKTARTAPPFDAEQDDDAQSAEPNSPATENEAEPEAEVSALSKGWRTAAWSVAMVLAAILLAIVGWLIMSWKSTTSSLDVISDPDGANVWLNDELKGQTPFHQNQVDPGTYNVRIEKSGFLTYTQQFMVAKRQPASITVKLARLPEQAINPEELLGTAQFYFNQGKLAEAGQKVDLILSRYPQHASALELRDKIHEQLLAQQQPAQTAPETAAGETNQPPQVEPAIPPPSPAPKAPAPEPHVTPVAPVPPKATPQAMPATTGATYEIIHNHFIGSCRGVLVIATTSIAFRPADNSDEAFSKPIGAIEKIEVGSKLKIQFKDKVFRFEMAGVANDEENRQKLIAIYGQLMELMAKARK